MIIVTGGAGFIGSNIVKELNVRNLENILVVDNLSNNLKKSNLRNLKYSNYEDKNSFIENLSNHEGIRAIFHQGACSSTIEKDGFYMMKNNYEYSKRLLDFSIENEIPFIYASSASVYGNGAHGFTENKNCENPLNIYAYSKFAFDRYASKFLTSAKSQIVGLRYFNVYGPGEGHKGRMSSVALHLFNELKNKSSMTLYEGSKNFFRDFIYIDDVVKVNMFFFDNGKSGIFNCGTGREQSFYEIAENLKRLNNAGDIKFTSFPNELKEKYQTFTKSDNKLLLSAGYNDSFDNLDVGLKKYFKILNTMDRA